MRTLSILIFASFLSGCAGFDPRDFRTMDLASRSAPTWRGLPVETGQIVVSEHAEAGSLFLSLIAERYEPFIHGGLIVFDDGEPFVYESYGAMRPHGRTPPNHNMGGGVRRVSLASFLRRDRIMAIYDPPSTVDRARLAEFARARWRERTPFDGAFDARDASRFYCVEFVARALEAAGSAPVRTTPVRQNASLGVVLRWLEIDTPELLLAGSLIEESRRVALIARRRTVHEIERYFRLKAELHRRFTDDQRLGAVMSWRLQGLHLRPQVARFLKAGMAGDVAPERLADEMFGPVGARARARLADGR